MNHKTKTDKGIEAFVRFRDRCPYFLEEKTWAKPRPCNGLNIEIGSGIIAPRCVLKRPAHWSESFNSLNWIFSGGSIVVFGCCERNNCALGHKWCPECGHRKESHMKYGCIVGIESWPCGCNHYE